MTHHGLWCDALENVYQQPARDTLFSSQTLLFWLRDDLSGDESVRTSSKKS